ncbi:MAG: hypothetical protein Q3M30_16760 [Candidatus Electrothrix sp. Rat3]|nr:hypothetical protein [Candidatus Electrothrix sp. AR5]MCI5218334.1 hypothetical protein [Candidatus Electrothrix sp. LOE2]MDU9050499.1 hypothetical protein [Candidatus Electrothrix rattekaaiensis]
MKRNEHPSFTEQGIEETAKKSVKSALLLHRAMGNEIVYWRDGKIIREKLTSDNFPTETMATRQSNEPD